MRRGSCQWSLACALLVACSGASGASDAATSDASSASDTTGGDTSSSSTGDGEVAPAGIFGPECPPEWAGGSVVVETENGSVALTNAFFGYISCGGSEAAPIPGMLTLYFADASTDSAAVDAFEGTFVWVWLFWDYQWDGWLQSGYPYTTYLYEGGQLAVSYPDTQLHVRSMSGSWDAFDPEDPPVLHGTIDAPDPSGPHGSFDAVFCGALIDHWCPD